MDPLSVAASVAGLAAAATKVARSLYHFTVSIEDAPRLARNVRCETEALAVIFSQLNGFLRNTAHPKRSRMSMTTVDQFITLITHCVLTFAELEEELDGIDLGCTLDFEAEEKKGADRNGGSADGSNNSSSDRGMGWWDRVKWFAREDIVKELLADLQQQKLSLNLMIGIWTCKTNMEAVKSYEELCKVMLMIHNREQPRGRQMSAAPRDIDYEKANPEFANVRLSRIKRTFSSKTGDANARSSLLSVISLDQVTDISALSLPLYTSELYNGGKYAEMAHMTPANRTRVRPKSVMFSWAGGGGGMSGLLLQRRQRSLVRKVVSLWQNSSRSPSPPAFEISEPFDTKHNTHIGVDPDSGKMRIVGQESAETIAARKVGWMA